MARAGRPRSSSAPGRCRRAPARCRRPRPPIGCRGVLRNSSPGRRVRVRARVAAVAGRRPVGLRPSLRPRRAAARARPAGSAPVAEAAPAVGPAPAWRPGAQLPVLQQAMAARLELAPPACARWRRTAGPACEAGCGCRSTAPARRRQRTESPGAQVRGVGGSHPCAAPASRRRFSLSHRPLRYWKCTSRLRTGGGKSNWCNGFGALPLPPKSGLPDFGGRGSRPSLPADCSTHISRTDGCYVSVEPAAPRRPLLCKRSRMSTT